MASGFGLNGAPFPSLTHLRPTPSIPRARTPLDPRPVFGHDADAPSFSITGPSRCFPFWQEVLACYVTNSSAENKDGKSKCLATLDDYYECLHHKKEHAKTFAMQAALRRAEAQGIGREGERKPEDVKTLGLLPGGPEEKNLKTGIIPAKGPSLY
ncbi:nadh:ubiquinone oxidoreductase subunit [Diplodia corticola]|uniref:NADH dehydrogenase [ubiquinone] iron-sulfur protein 5 n=1 Tax=Diplodia corticola TaxID=236234 RepID=A0A1J9QUE4_9PEZI|nr:nadh:ubiquinone oxidoreductase subunit [Diplodia corticola]OJD32064.1 nadh:ubiquinone oxidoreductase subunit [Diplodia corticola]